MKKNIFFLLIASSLLIADSNVTYSYTVNPLNAKVKSKDNGGVLDVIDAYSDGIGAFFYSNKPFIKKDQKIFNNLVFKYGESAKKNHKLLKEEVLSSDDASQKDKLSINAYNNSLCNDNNPNTIDSYESGVCFFNSKVCDDNNPNTIDILSNGSCTYKPKICDDKDQNTIDSIVDGKCVFSLINCDDGDDTTEDIPVNGLCTHIKINCDDNNPNTNDSVVNGICVNKIIDCNDNNPNTRDSLDNGVCINKLIECNDDNPNTTDKVENGICIYTPIACNSGYELINGKCELQAPQIINIISINGIKEYSNGSAAISCNEYKNKPREGYVYEGSIGSGFYKINPLNNGNYITVYCDMTTDGGGWTKVIQQYETKPLAWNIDSGIYTSNNSFILTKLPIDRTQTAFGKDNNPTYIDYFDFIYTTGNIAKTKLKGIKTNDFYHIYRNNSFYYTLNDPDGIPLKGVTKNDYDNSLTLDKTPGIGYDWCFSPKTKNTKGRGYSLGGVNYSNQVDSFAWTLWVR